MRYAVSLLTRVNRYNAHARADNKGDWQLFMNRVEDGIKNNAHVHTHAQILTHGAMFEIKRDFSISKNYSTQQKILLYPFIKNEL